MKTNSEYIPCKIDNIFKNLKDEDTLLILGLLSASNDLMLNHSATKHFSKNESEYFNLNSISILREIAKLINKISSRDIRFIFSNETNSSFEKLQKSLSPFKEGTLTKSVLKPIRDVHFHYCFDNKENGILSNMIKKIKTEDKLDVAKIPNNKNIFSFRYTYADNFKNDYIDSYLSKDLVKNIAALSVETVVLVDSIQFDILKNTNNEFT